MSFNGHALLSHQGAHDCDSLQAGTWEELYGCRSASSQAGLAYPAGDGTQLWTPACGMPLGAPAVCWVSISSNCVLSVRLLA